MTDTIRSPALPCQLTEHMVGVDPDEDVAPSALADRMEAAHGADLWSQLPRLSELAARAEEFEGERHPELVSVHSLFRTLRSDLESHLMREEQIVFPLIREIIVASQSVKRPNGTLRNPLDVLHDDHERVGVMLDELRTLTDNFTAPDNASAVFRSFYDGLAALAHATQLHMHLENSMLFPAIAAIEHDLLAALEPRAGTM